MYSRSYLCIESSPTS